MENKIINNLKKENKKLKEEIKNLKEENKNLNEENKKLKLDYLNNINNEYDIDEFVKNYFYTYYVSSKDDFKYILEKNCYNQIPRSLNNNKLIDYIKKKYDNNYEFINSLYINDDSYYNKDLYNEDLNYILYCFNLFDYIDKDTYYLNENIKNFYIEYNEIYNKDYDHRCGPDIDYLILIKNNTYKYINWFFDEIHILEKFKKLNDYLDNQFIIFKNKKVEKDDNDDNDNDDDEN